MYLPYSVKLEDAIWKCSCPNIANTSPKGAKSASTFPCNYFDLLCEKVTVLESAGESLAAQMINTAIVELYICYDSTYGTTTARTTVSCTVPFRPGVQSLVTINFE